MPIVQRSSCADDLIRILDLLATCYRAGYADMELLSTSVRLALANPDLDRRDTLLLERDGNLVGFGILWNQRYLGMLVAPCCRGALESRIIDWAEQRVALSGNRRLTILSRADDPVISRTCWARGYAVDRQELRMVRPLDLPLPDVAVPAGFTIRALCRDVELDDWLTLYTDAFGLRPEKLRYWRSIRCDPDHQPVLDLVALDADGRLAGMCYGSIPRVEAAVGPAVVGRTEPVAIRRDAQRRGLGQALVTASLALLREHGASVVMLTTEADNIEAHRFYQSLGYQVAYRARWYGRDLHHSICCEVARG